MNSIIIGIFVLGYLCIALEHKLKIDKAAISLLMFGLIWSVYACCNPEGVGNSLIEHLGSTCETLIFLIGAMTIVEIVDSHGGFSIITEYVTTRSKYTLLWVVAVMTFFLSAVLDNMTTAIVLIMMIRRIVPSTPDRLLYAAIIIIAANSGGAWSPIGDVTTIMLWMRGNVTTLPLMMFLFVPCVVSLLVPTWFLSRKIGRHDKLTSSVAELHTTLPEGVGKRFSRLVLIVGIAGLLFVPIFKAVTGLPPYIGIMLSLSILWIITECAYAHKRTIPESHKNRVTKLLKRIDMPTILFFLGILMSVAGLQSVGLLSGAARFLDTSIHEVFTISTIIGVLSSVIDNVPLVAACIGMYPIADVATVAASADPTYMQAFVQDGIFWLLLTYCAGVGGSMLIIGSAAGVVVMGLEKINFTWYLKHITPIMFLGYMAGVATIFVEWLLLFP